MKWIGTKATSRACAATLLLGVLGLAGHAVHGQSTVYDYQVPASGYDSVGNLTSSVDSVNGAWSMQYDSLNRFGSASGQSGHFAGYAISEQYDSFGNRLAQAVTFNGAPTQQTTSAVYDGSAGGQTCPHPGSNRFCATSLNGRLPDDASLGMENGYDAAGNLLSDGVNYFRYDAEGRLCASYSTIASGYTQYVYDAEGNRVAKAAATSFTCPGAAPPPASAVKAKYLLGPSGEQITELDGGNNWVHTNVYAGGALLAVYSPGGLHFPISDPLSTARIEVLSTGLGAGQVDQQCYSLPFGDGQFCDGGDATEHHFTGKERDNESGLDYFGTRYYGSNMGRFSSPDPSNWGVDFYYPQSWNKYAYVAIILFRQLTLMAFGYSGLMRLSSTMLSRSFQGTASDSEKC